MTQAPTGWSSTGPVAKTIIAGEQHLVARLAAKMFEKAYSQLTFPATSSNKYTLPGLIVALNSVSNKYVPWVTDARHGAGSDTAVGILTEYLVLTTWDRMCSPMYTGEAIEANCYTEDSAIGTIAAGIKTSLSKIEWK